MQRPRIPTSERLSPADGERIARQVAHHVGAEVHFSALRVSAALPETGEQRFERLPPPVVAAPSFAIRKPAVAIFTFEDYVAAADYPRRLRWRPAVHEFQTGLGIAKGMLATRLRDLTEHNILEAAPASDGSAYPTRRHVSPKVRIFIKMIRKESAAGHPWQ